MTRDALVEANLGLVHACAKRFKGRGIEYEELYAAGCLGLVKAVEAFDPDRGYQLSTYAVPVILGEIRRLFRDGGAVKLSRSLQELSLRAKRVAEAYRKEHDGEMTVTALAESLGVDTYRAAEALSASRAVLSLSPVDDDDEGINIPVESAEERLTDRLSLQQAMSELDDEERALIRLRYYQHKTQTETAKLLSTTQVQISRREKKILKKLRELLI